MSDRVDQLDELDELLLNVSVTFDAARNITLCAACGAKAKPEPGRLLASFADLLPGTRDRDCRRLCPDCAAKHKQALASARQEGAEAMRRACVWAAKEAAAGYREDQAGAEAVLGAIEAMRPPGDPVAHRVASMAHEVSDHQAATAEALADALSALPVPEVGDE